MSLDLPCSLPPADDETLIIEVESDGDAAPVRMIVSGDLDCLSAEQLRAAFLDVLRRHRPMRVEMSMRNVKFLDSAGIRALVLCRDDAELADCQVTLVQTPATVHRVLEITGLLTYFGVDGPAER
jgi:anti-anti-sigma factor